MKKSSPPSRHTIRCLLASFIAINHASGAAPLRSAGNGAWSSPSTWEGGRVPASGDVVLVRPGDRVVYDMATETVIRAVHVGGTLAFSHDKDTLLCAGLIRIAPGGLYYRVKNWDFKVTCENLADKRYFLASQGFPDIIQPGAPRTFTFGAQYRF